MAQLAPRPFTVGEYHRIADAGLFADERVELLGGVIVTMSPIGRRHWRRHATICAYLLEILAARALVVPQGSFPLGDHDEPQPDIAVLARYVDEAKEIDVAHDIYAAIELAESSLAVGLGPKLRLYARFGIPDYVVIDLAANTLLHHTEPHDLGYRRTEQLGPGGTFAFSRVPDVVVRCDPFLAP